MKKTPSPLIIRPGHIRKLKSCSGERPTGNFKEKNGRRSKIPALDYIISGAKRVSGVFSSLFFWHKKVDSNSGIDQVHSNISQYQPGRDSFSSSSSVARDVRKSPGSKSSNSGGFPFPQAGTRQFRSSLTFEEIHKATGNFSPVNKIGEGGFGTVFKGVLRNGSIVAIKRAKSETYDQRLSEEFKNEILAMSKIEHLSLVRFYGYIEHGNERLIVVEYVSNGTLREHLDGTHGSGLETAERLDIAIDVAHAITYLHTYSDPPIIHRDIKASNILITENLRAKVSDFGFARLAAEDPGATHISTQIKGTAGYLDPEYLKTYQLTEKSDVYSFGVLLVEMMTGRHPIESKRILNERITARWALKRLKDGEVVVVMDPRLQRNITSIQAVEKVLQLARYCLSSSRLSRPSMRKCAEVLWEIRREFRENIINNVDAAATSVHSPNVIERHTRRKSTERLWD